MNTALQAALAAVAEATLEASERELVLASKVRGLMVGYDARWHPEPGEERWVPIELERETVLPLVNPGTGRTSRTWRHGGKRDGIIQGFGQTVLLEHKTTSSNIKDPNDSYWRRLMIDSQVSHYSLEAWQEGRKLDGTLYDVVKKPGIRPKKLSKRAIKEIVMEGTYEGVDLEEALGEDEADELRARISASEITRETPDLYALRLAVDTIDRPDYYFQRRRVPRMDEDLMEYAEELWEVGEAIRKIRVVDRNNPDRNPWYRNPDACFTYGRPCTFLPLCAGYDTTKSDRWRERDQVHPELEELEGDGRDLLTNSRIRTFQTCKRKHFLKYELGISRADEDEGEALYIGTLWHLAQEAWWAEQTTGEAYGQRSEGSGVATEATPTTAEAPA